MGRRLRWQKGPGAGERRRRKFPQPEDQGGPRACRRQNARAVGTDAPGRAFSSVGAGRSAVEQTDWHAQEEDRFLHKLAARLDAAVNAGETKSLIMVAPPRALGVLRHAYSHAPAAPASRNRQGSRQDAPCTRSRSISRDDRKRANSERVANRSRPLLTIRHLLLAIRPCHAALAGCLMSLSTLPDRIASPSLPSARNSLTKSPTAARSRISCG